MTTGGMKKVVASIALSVCSPVIVISMLVLETVYVIKKALARRKVHPMAMVATAPMRTR
jgi:hypothetical protein